MNKTQIDKMCRKYQRGKLSEEQVKELAAAIKANKKTRDIAVRGLIHEGKLYEALKFIN